MKIELSDEGAALVHRLLNEMSDDQDEIDRHLDGAALELLCSIIPAFVPAVHTKAILRAVVESMTEASCETCGDHIHRQSERHRWVHRNAEPRDHAAVPEDEGEELVCGNCGNSEFTADEELIDSRPMREIDDEAQIVFFDSHQNTGDGGGGTVIVCTGCQTIIDLPDGWVVEYS